MMITPVKIKNPDTPCRVVRLKPTQQIELKLTEEYDSHSITLQSDYLRISTVDEVNRQRIFRIKQTDNALGSNLCSTFYLGEINLSMGNILVYLEAAQPEKKDVITIVNPGYDSIRMKPHQVLEVVCYNPQFSGMDDLWLWEWCGEVELETEELGYRCTIPYYYQPQDKDDIYSMLPRVVGDHRCTQHHFWIRFTKSILEVLGKEDLGRAKYVGKFIFRGFPSSGSSESVESVIDLYLDGNKKYLQKCLQTLTLPTHSDYVRHNEFTAKQHRKLNPIARDVEITKVDTAFDVGCRVIWDERQLCM